jgi:hypothetical protein
MYAYFPEMYPDESLYSVLARLRMHLGGLSSMQFQRWLYSGELHTADFELVGGVNVIAHNAHGTSARKLDALIDEHTGLNYYLRYLEPQLAVSCRRMYASGEVRGLLIWTGSFTSNVGRIKGLRYCSKCLEIMHASYGEFYWRRAHNLPGSLVCPDHGCPLSLSSADLHRGGRFDFISADMAICSAREQLVCDLPPEVLPMAQQLAKISEGFFKAFDPYQNRVEWAAGYEAEIRALGLLRGTNTIDVNKLSIMVNEVYSEIYPYLQDYMSEGRGGFFPILRMLRKPKSGFHPLDHALMQVFLSRAGSPRARAISRIINLPESKHQVLDAGYRRPHFKDLEDWDAIDRVLRDAVLLIADCIGAERPPVRISRAEIERRLPVGGRVGKRLAHLPKTAEVLRSYVETTQDFQTRRVRWHISQFVRLGRPITAAAIMKASSIRFIQRSRIEQLIVEFKVECTSEAGTD